MNASSPIIAAAAQTLMEQITYLMANVNLSVAAAALAIPVVLAAFSRRLSAVALTLLLAAVVIVAIAAPAAAGTLVAVACYVAACILALAALQARRRDRAIQAQIQALKMDVDGLLAAEQRRVIVELTARRKPADDANIAAE
jgi:hypothetical protein